MRKRLLPTLLLLAIIGLAWTAALDIAFSIQLSPETSNYETSYTFTAQNGYYRSDNTLYVSLPPSLEEYYQGKSHSLTNENAYPKFVTPNAVQSIAENIRNITRNTPYDDEEFANAVLMIVREIPYVRSNAKYPVETIVDNSADCDGLSILAASIMKAGGLDVVLLLYKGINPTHMNVGVHLEHMPVSHSWWMMPSGVDYNNKTYWVAECTSLAGWTVGDQPNLLAHDKPQIIPLEKCEKKSPASISSSLNSPMQPSSISINLSTGYSNVSGNVRAINISGSISPAFPNEIVAIYVNQPGYPPSAFVTATDEFGNYTLPWNVTLPGTYITKASWSGSFNHSSSDSETLTVFVGTQQPPITELPNYFWDGGYSGTPSQAYSPAYVALLNQGAKEFLNSNLTGTDVVLSGEFMILSDGHEVIPTETTITIPAHQNTYRLPGTGRNRQTIVIQVPERTVTIPGIEQLNGQFGFMLERNGEYNYTATVKLLTNDDVSQITQSLDDSKAMYMNSSSVATKNAWHKAIAKVSGDEVAVEVYDENGTRLDDMAKSTTSTGFSELGILMTYPVGQVLAFKNLKVEALSQNPKPITENQAQGNGIEILFPYIRISLLLAGTAMAIVCLKERKEINRHPKGMSDSSQH
jgi:hypothetical protein